MSNAVEIGEELSSSGGSASAAVVARYRQAYQHANTLNRFGDLAKLGGLILGGLITFVGFVSCASSASSNSFGAGVGIFGGSAVFIAGVVIGACGFILGILIQSQGQQLLAHLDCAVHGSPFLSQSEKAVAMGL